MLVLVIHVSEVFFSNTNNTNLTNPHFDSMSISLMVASDLLITLM